MNDYLSRNDEILQLIADDNINRAISRLLDFIRDFCSDSDLLRESLLISANHKKLMREERQNLIDYQAANRMRSRIISQILSICKDVCSLLEEKYQASQIQREIRSEETKAQEVTRQIKANEDEKNLKKKKFDSSSPNSIEKKKYKQNIPLIAPTQILESEPRIRPICKISNLHKKYSKSGFSLKNISLTINSNEIIGVVGENGNGKTTFFRILSGELKHDKGSILFPAFNENQYSDLNWINIKNRIAYVKQEIPRWYGALKENLHYEATIHGIKGKQNREDVDFILHRLGLIEYQDRKWHELSGGYKLRFTLAKALVWKPSFIILDEPLANLDIHAQILVLNDLRDLANSIKYPISIVISSQHLHEVEHISDKILFIRNGEPLFYGKKEELGKDREYNFFEIQSNLSKRELNDILSNLKIADIIYNGLHYQIIADRSIQSNDLIKQLLANQVKLTYFRDISTSTKKLFI